MREELGIFPSPRAFIQGTRYIGRLAPHFALSSPKAFTGGEARNFSKSESLYERELGIFQKSQCLYKGRNVRKSHPTSLFSFPELHISSHFPYISSDFLHISTYFLIFFTYSHILLHIFCIFLHILSYFLHISSYFPLFSHQIPLMGEGVVLADFQ